MNFKSWLHQVSLAPQMTATRWESRALLFTWEYLGRCPWDRPGREPVQEGANSSPLALPAPGPPATSSQTSAPRRVSYFPLPTPGIQKASGGTASRQVHQRRVRVRPVRFQPAESLAQLMLPFHLTLGHLATPSSPGAIVRPRIVFLLPMEHGKASSKAHRPLLTLLFC